MCLGFETRIITEKIGTLYFWKIMSPLQKLSSYHNQAISGPYNFCDLHD